jgi:hypothetical protein
MKAVPGRKSDVRNAEWIQLLEHGPLAPSFVPPPEIRRLRMLTQYRVQLTGIGPGPLPGWAPAPQQRSPRPTTHRPARTPRAHTDHRPSRLKQVTTRPSAGRSNEAGACPRPGDSRVCAQYRILKSEGCRRHKSYGLVGQANRSKRGLAIPAPTLLLCSTCGTACTAYGTKGISKPLRAALLLHKRGLWHRGPFRWGRRVVRYGLARDTSTLPRR